MTTQLETYERAVDDTERAGEEYAKAARLEATLRNGRHGVKQEAVKRLMEPTRLPNRRAGINDANAWAQERRIFDKGYQPGLVRAGSVSAAEKMVELDPDYAAHLDAERDATFEKNMAYTRLITARLRALGILFTLLNAQPGLKSLVATEVDLDLLRARDDDREQLVGGVPK